MLEKLESCPRCDEVKQWLYDAQMCASCHYPSHGTIERTGEHIWVEGPVEATDGQTGRPDGWVPVEIGPSKPILCCPPCLDLARTVLKAFFTYGRLIRAQNDAAGDENSAKESEGGT